MTQDPRPLIEVVAGIVLNESGGYLLSSRPEGKPYAGYWEFAGGKVEAGESLFQALQREFEEELGIRIHRATPWLTKIHAYEHAHVRLNFLRVEADEWSGKLQAKEGQAWSWQKAGDFTVSPMLPANGPLLKALSVPRRFSGSLAVALYGENGCGAYIVVPHRLAEAHHAHVWLDERDLAAGQALPQAESVWLRIQNAEQWPRVQDADVAVWQVAGEASAQAVLQRLRQGVALPLVVEAAPDLAAQYESRWLAAGAHAVILNTETEAV